MLVKDLQLGLDYNRLGFCKTGHVRFTAYLPQSFRCNEKTPAVIVLPGGGYGRTAQKESDPIAMQFAAAGIASFVLHYSVAPARFPQQMIEALAAIRMVRQSAKAWAINPHAICLCGFSAGAHLSLCAANLCGTEYAAQYGFGEGDRPNALILGYPLISTDAAISHPMSLRNLLGESPSRELLELLSMEKQVSRSTPPVFLFHSFEDPLVPVLHSLRLAEKLYEEHVPLEMHIYPHGGHALGLAREFSDISAWSELAVKWIFKNFNLLSSCASTEFGV